MIEIIAGVAGVILCVWSLKLAVNCPLSEQQRKSFEKDEYLRGKK